MHPSTLLYMYRRRLRKHAAQEAFAGFGIAIAVALVFAAVVSEASISNAAEKVVRTVVGSADFQLRSRGASGFGEATVAQAKHLPGVAQAAPLLEQTATIAAANGRRVRVQVAGTDLRLAVIDGLAETLPIGSLSTRGIGLSRAAAHQLHIDGTRAHGQHVAVLLRGRVYRLPVTAVLGPEAAGALSQAAAAVMPLSRLQQLAGLPGKVTRVFVQAQAGHKAQVRSELSRLAGGRLELAPGNGDVALLKQALGPSDLASGLFAAIGALLGFLLAFNAMLLTVSDRRRTIADLRICGARRMSVMQMVVFEALCLGIPASLAGLCAGYGLSVSVFHQSTGYLAEAFTLSGGTVVTVRAVALAFAGGVLATCLASMVPLLDLRKSRSRDAVYQRDGVPGHALGAVTYRRLAAAALCLLAGASVLWALLPAAAILATGLLALATLLAVPLTLAAVLRAAAAAGERLQRISILPLVLSSLRATTVRSLALAATGAVALFGSVALGGSRQNLLSGIKSFAHSYVADADIWVSNPGDNQAVEGFSGRVAAARIAHVPGVASVQTFQGDFLQLGTRRVWAIARPPGGERRVLESQIRSGGSAAALERLAAGG
jgi:putative ABC transport system permease protein